MDFNTISGIEMITIVNYEMGNLRSVRNALNYLGFESKISDSPEEILNAEKIILPGVGSFRQAMENIKKMGLYEPICKKVLEDKTPILGICLGMQLLAKSSEEDGFTEGFGFIDGEVVKFDIDKKYRVPHVGFNSVTINPDNKTLFEGLKDRTDFYFVHSYRLSGVEKPFVSAICKYGEKFVASFEQDNVFGTQFHPEKSQSNGLKLLINFAKL